MRSIWRLAALLACAAPTWHPPVALRAAEAPSPAPRASEELCRAARDSRFPWYGNQRADEIRRLLDSGTTTPPERATLLAELGLERLKHDRTDDAVALLEEAIETGRTAGLPPSARRDATIHLALAHLQAAEDRNCLRNHNASRCIVPFAPEALHDDPEPARRAGDLLREVAGEMPGALHIRWLLNLARMVSDDWPEGVPPHLRLPAGALEPAAGLPRWTDRAHHLGVGAVDLAGGAVVDDFDGDGLLDLVSSTWDPCDGIKAFRNDGRGGFEEVAARWGLAEHWGGLNLTHADYDGDGDLDLLLLRGAWMGGLGRIENVLLRNDLDRGEGFNDVTRAAGLAQPD